MRCLHAAAHVNNTHTDMDREGATQPLRTYGRTCTFDALSHFHAVLHASQPPLTATIWHGLCAPEAPTPHSTATTHKRAVVVHICCIFMHFETASTNVAHNIIIYIFFSYISTVSEQLLCMFGVFESIRSSSDERCTHTDTHTAKARHM